MPNQRKKGKTKVTFWVNEVEKEMLMDVAKSHGLNMTETLRLLLLKDARKNMKRQTPTEDEK